MNMVRTVLPWHLCRISWLVLKDGGQGTCPLPSILRETASVSWAGELLASYFFFDSSMIGLSIAST